MKSPLDQSVAAMDLASSFGREYLLEIPERRVSPSESSITELVSFDEDLPTEGLGAMNTIEHLASKGSPATVASAAGRFFGLVVGGSLPAALGARVVTSAWDQVVLSDATSPIGAKLEEVASEWVLELLGLPTNCSVGFVTGTTMGNFLSFAAARYALLKNKGWDVQTQGLWGAPRIRIIASEQIHITAKKALSMLGMGIDAIEYVPCDEDGVIIPEQIPEVDDHCLVILQAGNVNSGALDPVGEVCEKLSGSGAWVHVDGAFGLWSAVGDVHDGALVGMENADSWVTDGHKWLNTPYECGIAICRHPDAVHNSMATVAPYLEIGGNVAPKDMVPEFSRGAKAAEVWAAIRSLGRNGLQTMFERNCAQAKLAATLLKGAGFEIMNKVVLNQVVVTLDQGSHVLPEVAKRVVSSGDAWFGPTVWRGKTALRLSFSSWVTSEEDVRIAVNAIIREAKDMSLL